MKKLSQIPQIRVKGFTQEWTKHLLNYYLETSQEKNFDGLYQREDVLSVSGDYGIVNQIEFQGRSFAGASVLNYGVVHTGDVVYTKSPLKENPYGIIKTNTGKAGVVSTLVVTSCELITSGVTLSTFEGSETTFSATGVAVTFSTTGASGVTVLSETTGVTSDVAGAALAST